MIAFLLGCGTAPDTPVLPEAFVRTGILGTKGRALPGGRHFEERAWAPGESVDGTVAPQVAECVALSSVTLGDLTQEIAMGISAPDTALAFSPDGSRLAVGTRLGEVLVLDGWTGEVLRRRSLPEAIVKRLAWSADGAELFAAEQSPDAFLLALDPVTLETRAQFRMADELESSAPPATDDLYGIYTLPGAYGLEVLDGGDLLLLGTHGWNGQGGRQNRSRIWRLKREGKAFSVVSAWPEKPADATFMAMGIAGERVAVSVSKSSATPVVDLPVGGLAVLDGALSPEFSLRPPPLQPWFDKAFIWEAIGLDARRVVVGLGDGRVVAGDASGVLTERALSTPVLSGEVPIVATIGSLAVTPESVYTVTSGSSIPYSANRPELQPPEPHPQEDTLFALDPETLANQWIWRGEEALHGMTLSDRWIVVGVGPKPADDSPDRHGVVVFDRTREGTGAERLSASCHTGDPVFFRAAIAPDGRIAVVSFPERVGDSVRGSYKVTLFL